MLLREAAERNLTTEVISEDDCGDLQQLNSSRGPFGSRVLGIISLKPFERKYSRQLGPGRVPLVFFGGQAPFCTPNVASDMPYGYYALTRHVLDRGHRQVLLCAYPNAPERVVEAAFDGYATAMREFGLVPNVRAFKGSIAVPDGDIIPLRDWLKGEVGRTAVVGMSLWRAQDLVRAVRMMDLSVPADVSVVSHDSGPVNPQSKSETFTCVDRDFETMARVAFDLIFEQAQTRECPVGHIAVSPLLIEGHSLVPPRGAIVNSRVYTKAEEEMLPGET